MKKLLLISLLAFISFIQYSCKSNSSLISESIKENRQVDKNLTNTYVIDYDFMTGTYLTNNLKVKVNNPVVFRITNINRLAYKIDIKASDSIIGYSDISGLEDLLKKEKVDEIKKEIEKADKNSASTTSIIPLNSEDFKNTVNKESITKEVNNFTQALSNKTNTEISNINNHSDADVSEIEKIKVSENLEKLFPFHFESQKKLTTIYLNALEKHQKIISLWNDYLKVRSTINSHTFSKPDISDKNLLEIFKNFSDNKNIFDDFNLLCKRFQNLYNSMKSNPEITENTSYGGSVKLFNIADNLNNEMKSLKEQIDIINCDKIKQDIIQINKLLTTNETSQLFTYTSDPIQPIQDVVIFKIDIKKNEKDQSLFYNERKFPHKEFTKNGLRFDLSLGLAGSFHNNKDFYALQFNSNNEQVIVKQPSESFTPSFVGLFTSSLRSSNHFAAGLSVGLGISADQGSIAFDNFFIGPSLIMGKYERVTLTAGAAFRNLPKLNSTYSENQIVPNGYKIDNVTTKSYQAGFFLSVTYNITKGVKDNIKQVSKYL